MMAKRGLLWESGGHDALSECPATCLGKPDHHGLIQGSP